MKVKKRSPAYLLDNEKNIEKKRGIKNGITRKR